jgi:cyclase
MKLTKNICVETKYMGANVSYIITEEGLVMVDAPYKPTDALEWHKEIEGKGSVRYLINVEAHDDHFAGSFFFDTTVVAQEKTREDILATDINQMLEVIAIIDPEGRSLVDDYKINTPTICFSDRLDLYLGKHSFHLIHLPGHTRGQTAVLVPEERTVFTGDNVTYQVQGFLHTADPYSWLESIKRIEELDVDFIVPGHGEVCDKSFLKEETDYVRGCMNAVEKAIDQGWTREEAVAQISLTSPYPLDDGTEEIGPELLRISVANLYEVISQHRAPYTEIN